MGVNLGDLKVPNLWYDVYARLLPGTAFVGAVYYLFSAEPKIPDGEGILVALFCGYFFGFIAQPFSSEITGLLQYIVAKIHGENRLYVERIQKELLDDKQSMILSKMHGETTFFVQCAVLGIVLLLIRVFYPQVHGTMKAYVLHACLCLLFLIEAVEVAIRRFNRAKDQKAIKDRKPADVVH